MARVLLVDDEPQVTQSIRLGLRREPFEIECADSGPRALELLADHPFDVVVSDERMPGMAGSELLSIVREKHPDVARIILSGQANLDAALRAINSAEIHRFLVKPCPADEIGLTIKEALAARDERVSFAAWQSERRAGRVEVRAQTFEREWAGAWMGFQPILHAKSGALYGYEALLRSDDPAWRGPSIFLTTAEELGKAQDIARRIRALIADRIERAPVGGALFVNVNPHDLQDEVFVDGRDALGRHASSIVLEITERHPLKDITDLESRVERLRKAGYRIAVDDIGAGYSGLTSVALLAPDVVKFDMDLVRGIDRSPTKQKLVEPIVQMCRDLGVLALAEGIETEEERDTVVRMGCDLLQGFLFGRATREVPCSGASKG